MINNCPHHRPQCSVHTGGIASTGEDANIIYGFLSHHFHFQKSFGIDRLIAIGGDGTFRGCVDFYKEYKLQAIGVPATIDNDLYGTDFTIGYDTAVNTALDVIDKIRDTSQSHNRFFIIEVMGRYAGFISLETGIAGGAESILIPEIKTDVNKLCSQIKSLFARGKTSNIVVVAEGDDAGGAYKIGAKIKQKTGINYRAVILGHIQRGGNPSAKDRLLASKLGYWSVKHLVDGKANVMVGEINGKIVLTDMEDSVGKKNRLIWMHLKWPWYLRLDYREMSVLTRTDHAFIARPRCGDVEKETLNC